MYSEYFQVVRASLASYNEECVTEVSNANKYLSMLVGSKSGRMRIKNMFKYVAKYDCGYRDMWAIPHVVEMSIFSSNINVEFVTRLCDELENDRDDIANLFENLAGNFADVVQYNKDNRDSGTRNLTVDVVCDVMTEKSLGNPVRLI